MTEEHAESKIHAVAWLASEFITARAPGVPHMAEVADHVAGAWGITTDAARAWLRQAVASDLLVELHPDNTWQVDVGDITLYLNRVYPEGRGLRVAPYRYELATTRVVSGYLPARMTFLLTPERVRQAVAAARPPGEGSCVDS